MARTDLHPRIRPARCLALTIVFLIAASSSGFAQNSPIGDALLAWCGGAASCRGPAQSVSDLRLYGGVVTAQIDNQDNNDGKLGSADRVPYFEVRPSGNPAGGGLCFPNPSCLPASATDDTTSAAFNAWVQSNAKDLLNILFPASLSEGVSGKDAAANYSQQFLLNTAMAFTSGEQSARLRQSEAGALFEFERFGGDGRPGIGLQGIYRMDGVHMSILGRYSQQSQNGEGPFGATTTRAVTITTDYHPSVVVYPALDLRVGFDARTGLLFSRAAELNLGSLDFGGGAWMSARKDFSRVRIGFSSLMQGSKSYLPIAADNLKFLADAVNDTPVAFDISFGVLGGYALTTRMSLNGKVVQTTPQESAGQARANSTIVMGGVSYLVGGLTPIDVGYKVYRSGPMTSHSVYLQGYYGW